MNSSSDASLGLLASYLSARRDALLNNWRTACEADSSLNILAGMSRQEFNNKVPFMLNGLEERMRGQRSEVDIKLLANEHGLHRWQKGYALHELLTEMHHLDKILLAELRQYWQHYPATEMGLVAQSYEQVAWFGTQSINGSVEQYSDLQRMAATARTEALQKALDELEQLTRQRGDLLRTSSHDLRSGLGVVQGAASLLSSLDEEGKSETERKQMLEMLNRNLNNVHKLVAQLMDLAHLEAGQESVAIQSFDVSQLLRTLVESYQSMATKRGLHLRADGPQELIIQTDPVQLQRIVQNLVLNAILHTQSGWVSVSWTTEMTNRWTLSVQDSGAGLANQQPGSFSEVLAPSAESSAGYGLVNREEDAREAANVRANKAVSAKGEGIGLSIVKHLCELLKAILEIETRPGQGALFRLTMAIHPPTPEGNP